MDNQWNNNQPNRQEEAHSSQGNVGEGFTPIQNGYEGLPPERKHSGLGIASFVIFFCMAALSVLMFVLAINSTASLVDPENPNPEELASRIQDMPELAIYGFGIIAAAFGHFVGLVLGIVALFRSNRKKVFSILGTIFNALVVGLILLLLAFTIIAISSGSV